ncbi:Bug family tripartite tricarboxylate transporter substrate binding protein [Roseicella frigidaeris]|nr:tripartite tricarboxylate transporter substrate-binding protein [Roseicella frigidaeris]
MRRRALLGGMLAAPRLARAEARAVRVVNAYAAGGTADIVCRLLFRSLAERTGRAYVVENRPGAAGTIAAAMVARAPPDGETLLYDATAFAVNPALFGPKLPYSAREDFLPVYLSLVTPNTIIATDRFPPRGVRALIEAAKAAPGRIDAGTTGIGSAQHITLALFNAMAGVEINHVVYRDAPTLRNDVAAGRVDLQVSNVPGTVTLLAGGKVRALAHTGLAPVAVLPGVEAVAETLPGFETFEWNGVFLPAGTPEGIRQSLNQALNAIAAEPAVAARVAAMGGIAWPNAPAEFAQFLDRQYALHARVVRSANIRID